ncbi:iron-sulfur cluster assembly accessory protein-like protein Isa1 [Mytilinidion resinicola]|uniref:Iron-sulfur assembly protein 1 n=1 Tax=Mytilinidion resinicola TaxID=574789 RepID=A0A6A6YIP5_9PEZI|nr:iron-sulfur cluster assembly accessory protein-like protein Isa1 [Mytilinidion resinicola]KAF2808671.1 iron-sulfur cluster assembly accessory protein-like protein Isa1 [Mytilinidion resinicola]
MFLPRTARPISSAATSFLHFAAQTSAPRQCPRCLRTFSSFRPFRQSSKRRLQTASAYHPSSLQPESLPPRNLGVPDTSIAGRASEVSHAWTPQPTEQRSSAGIANVERTSNFSLPEGEAQKSQPAQTLKPAGAKPRRYNFAARKATIKISKTAVSHLKGLLDQPEPKLIRIGTKAKGCSGLAYHLEYVDKPSKLDEQVEQDGVKVLIDNKALINIIGSEMDWVEDKLSARFVFKNPNITEQCGCGESFSVG